MRGEGETLAALAKRADLRAALLRAKVAAKVAAKQAERAATGELLHCLTLFAAHRPAHDVYGGV